MILRRLIKQHDIELFNQKYSFRDLILQCLDDRDESIRYRALDLIVGMISRKTLVEIVKKLMQHIEKAEGTAYRDELVAKIIQICSQSNYTFVTNFEWYVNWIKRSILKIFLVL